MNEVRLKQEAIFIADSHYNKFNRIELLEFLQTCSAPQIVLLGDIFDFLCGQVDFWINQNQELINIINQLAKTKEIYFFEGNHDYNLNSLFPEVIVVPRKMQPLIVHIGEKKYAIAHGDIFTNFGYNLYTKIIRNQFLLQFLNWIDYNHWLTRTIDTWLHQKNICTTMDDFESFAKKRLNAYRDFDIDGVIEGHYHQGEIYEGYINIPSYFCQKQKYGIIDKNYEIKWM